VVPWQAAERTLLLVAEADGNRTRQAGDARLNGFEDLNSNANVGNNRRTPAQRMTLV
jgi:hypothetical protein